MKNFLLAFAELFKDKDDFLFIALPLLILAGVVCTFFGSLILSGLSILVAFALPMALIWKVF